MDEKLKCDIKDARKFGSLMGSLSALIFFMEKLDEDRPDYILSYLKRILAKAEDTEIEDVLRNM